tara:strand:- start:42 stop:1337 length:1296 start_codon:yes stop_codon:yes gene_type:complete
MGFIESATTITVRARLTKLGREKLITSTNKIFSHFILGDSDANYNTSEKLTTGLIPSNSGDLGANSTTNDNIDAGVNVNSKLYVTVSPTTKKIVEPNSSKISLSTLVVGETTVSGSNLTFAPLDKSNTSTGFTNYYKSLSLPINRSNINTFTGTTSVNGGWSDTPFSGLGVQNVLMGVINNDQYGEMIDGKSIKMVLPVYTGFTSGGSPTGFTPYTIYSTFPNTTIPNTNLDVTYKDISSYPKSLFGKNINVAYLVSDDIQKPNNDANKSWSTGYDSFKPFSLNGKEKINVQTVTSTGINSDKIVGVMYLDKGIFAITDQTIVNNIVTSFSGDVLTNTITNGLGLYYYSGSSYNVVVDSIQNDLVQNIVCIAARGEFYNTQNQTLTINDDVRISEVAITDISGNVLAIGKTDRQIVKKKNDFVVFDVQIII